MPRNLLGEDRVLEKDDVIYRIKDPIGNIVVGPDTLLSLADSIYLSDSGYINNYFEAVTGPNTIYPGGYTPFVIDVSNYLLWGELRVTKHKYKTLSHKIEHYKEKLKEITPSICPLCDQEIKKGK